MPALLSSTYSEACLWQEQVPKPRPTTAVLPARADVVVISAGYCGLSAARAATEAGASVVVLAKESLGTGASTRNGGMVIPELKGKFTGFAVRGWAFEGARGQNRRRVGAAVSPTLASRLVCSWKRSSARYHRRVGRRCPRVRGGHH